MTCSTAEKRATLRERDAQLAQARENLARIRDEVAVRVLTAYNKVERTQQMVAVSQELLATRQEIDGRFPNRDATRLGMNHHVHGTHPG